MAAERLKHRRFAKLWQVSVQLCMNRGGSGMESTITITFSITPDKVSTPTQTRIATATATATAATTLLLLEWALNRVTHVAGGSRGKAAREGGGP